MVVLLSLGAAIAFALASVLQFQASSRSSAERNLRFSLLAHLAVDPIFLIGAAFDVIGAALQFIALKEGALTEVLPILAMGFLIAIVLEHLLAHRRLPIGDAIAMGVSAVALVGFLLLRPPEISTAIRGVPSRWVAGVTIALGVAAVTGLRSTIDQRGGLQAVFGAVLLGVVAVLEREVGILWSRVGVIHLLLHWQVWALIVIGVLSILVVQSAFQLRALTAVLPVLTVGEPIVAIALGLILLREPLLSSRTNSIESILLLVAEIASLIYLAHDEGRAASVEGGSRE
ncbi:MAG: DMT family transporter [Ferrimicrobium sp.]